jgi:hypothetical protein
MIASEAPRLVIVRRADVLTVTSTDADHTPTLGGTRIDDRRSQQAGSAGYDNSQIGPLESLRQGREA